MKARTVWFFGYGSLIWRPAFAYLRREPGYVLGWARRFWQGSPDHRGTQAAPGRVVTLIEEAAACCWGMAYETKHADAEAILASLDHREQGGYERVQETVHLRCATPATVPAFMYVARPGNPHYLGPAPIAEMTLQMGRACGPSGHNSEYVMELARALRELGAQDPHVFELAELMRAPYTDDTCSGSAVRAHQVREET